MIKKYNQFLNESILDHLKGPDKEEIKNNLLNDYKNKIINIDKLINQCNKLDITIPKEELKKYIYYDYKNNIINLNNYIKLCNIISDPLSKKEIRNYLMDNLKNNKITLKECTKFCYTLQLGLPTKEEIKEHYIVKSLKDSLIKYVYENSLKSVKRLIERGADVHIEHDKALRIACEKGYLDIVTYLVEQGADINSNYGSPLSYACGYNHLDIVKYLVEQGADINMGHLMSAKNYKDITEFLENKMKKNVKKI